METIKHGIRTYISKKKRVEDFLRHRKETMIRCASIMIDSKRLDLAKRILIATGRNRYTEEIIEAILIEPIKLPVQKKMDK